VTHPVVLLRPQEASSGNSSPADPPAAETAAAETAATETAAAETAATETAAGDQATADSAGADQAGADQAAEGPEYQPLEKVADQIRDKLAMPIARQRVDAAMMRVRNAMNEYYQEYIGWELNLQDGGSQEPKAEIRPFDLESVAQREGLEYGTIPLSDPFEVQEYDLGQAASWSLNPQTGLVQTSFLDLAYAPDFPMYSPATISGAEVDVDFVFWKTGDQPERVPELEDVRDEVVESIKREQALAVARDFAERDAEAVRAANKPLSEVFGDTRTVTPTGEITWLTTGSLPMGSAMPRLSTIPGVEMPDEDFFEMVFDAQPGQVVVAANHPQTAVYVVYVKRRTVEPEKLREQFLQNARTFVPLRMVAQQNRQRTMMEWIDEFRKQQHVKWSRPLTPAS
jgi:hypothetical protein